MMAAGCAALDVIQKEKLIANVRKQSRYLFEKLEQMKQRNRFIREVRGLGLMIGIELKIPGAAVVQAAAKRGLLMNVTQERVLRLYPALTIKRSEIDLGLKLLEAALVEVAR